MPKSNTQEERQLGKLVEKLPVPAEDKEQWLARIRGGEMSEELAEEIRARLNGLEEADDDQRGQANRTRHLTELAMLVRRWRLSSQSNNFRKR
jgi:hypothetical protein